MAEANRIASNDSHVPEGEYGYPIGHLGHLTGAQAQALEDFKKLLEEEKLYKPRTAESPASHDETTVLRFLRARRFVPKDALGQFKDTEHWREQNEITALYDNIDVGDYEETRRLYPQWIGRRDKRGMPVYVFEVAPLNSKTMAAYAKSSEKTTVLSKDKSKTKEKSDIPPRLYRLFALYENLTEFILPLCTNLKDRPHNETPISQSNNIVDISGVGLKQFWNLRTHMQDASVLATAHYPETLDRIFIVGAPSFFPTVWSWIKRWFDPITTSKIFILSEAQAYNTLSKFIEPANIPKKYGGTLDYTYGDPPVLDPAEEQHVIWKGSHAGSSKMIWPKGPMRWVTKDDGNWDIMAVGSVDGQERREMVATFHPDGHSPKAAASGRVSQISQRPTEPDTEFGAVPKAREEVAAATGPNLATSTTDKNGHATKPEELHQPLHQSQVDAVQAPLIDKDVPKPPHHGTPIVAEHALPTVSQHVENLDTQRFDPHSLPIREGTAEPPHVPDLTKNHTGLAAPTMPPTPLSPMTPGEKDMFVEASEILPTSESAPEFLHKVAVASELPPPTPSEAPNGAVI